MSILPWLEPALTRLVERRRAETFPHALLLVGPVGVGKRTLAAAVARMLVCEQPTAAGSCGECRACRLIAAGTHPDVREVVPEEGKRVIRIDQVRALCDFLMLKSQYAGYRVGVLAPAEAMNVNAANSLLKTLEEPPADAVLLLVSHQPAGLPATIRSRCQQISIPVPERREAEGWLHSQGEEDAKSCLDLAGGAPLRAIEYARAGMVAAQRELIGALADVRSGRLDPVAAAAAWSGRQEALIELLVHLVSRAIRAASIPGQRLHDAMDGLDLIRMHEYLDTLLEARRLASHPLNEQLVLEQLFIDWFALCRRSTTGKAHAGTS